MSQIEFRYSHAVDHETLDAWGEQELWDAAEDASRQYKALLVQFWSKATPKRRTEARANVDALGGK